MAALGVEGSTEAAGSAIRASYGILVEDTAVQALARENDPSQVAGTDAFKNKGCVALVQAADEPFNLFGANCQSFILRPLIGIITKIDSPYANIPMVTEWLHNAGCQRIFLINNVTREGIPELLEYLNEDLPTLTLEEAEEKQRMGLNEWDPLPDGV